MMVLGPGNDTRANLLLLLLDQDMPAPTFLPATSPPAPLPDDALPRLYWRDIRDRFFPSDARAEGSRCDSNAIGAKDFETAVNAAAQVTASERFALLEARKGLSAGCRETGKPSDEGLVPPEAPIPSIHSPAAHAFATYVRGAEAFYQGNYRTASERFSKLHGNANAWIADTADYMRARTALNRLQAGAFDKYGTLSRRHQLDQNAVKDAEQSLDDYLRDHPKGAYVVSARGLSRRIYWLTGRTEKLAAAYTALIVTPREERGIDDARLAQEIDSKLLPDLKPEMTRDPILLAVLDLLAMRVPNPSGRDEVKPAGGRDLNLEAQRDAFATTPRLFDHLVATKAFYLEHDPAKVMKLLPDETHRRGGDHLWFSRQVLRGLALEAKHDRNARGFWNELFPNAVRPLDGLTVQLALAMHDERSGRVDEVFAKTSIVTSQPLRERLLHLNAGPTLLRQIAKDRTVPNKTRDIALFALLWKEITRGRAADFIADLALVPAGAPTERNNDGQPPTGAFTNSQPDDLKCPALRTTARQLADDPSDVRARLCLAEFVRVNYLDDYSFRGEFEAGRYLDPNSFDLQPPGNELGGAPSKFPGKPYSRGETYKAIIADRSAPAEDRAFALYRAITCYEPVHSNRCGGTDVPKTQRKAWFQALKRDYPKSSWAELKYWW